MFVWVCVMSQGSMPRELACSACWVVARRYAKIMEQTGLSEETIQMGHRLDVNNKVPRKKYRESELRAIEVTEKLCEKRAFRDYQISEFNKTKYFSLSKSHIASTKDSDGYWPHERDVPRMLHNWCSFVLEQYEDEIETLIRKDLDAKAFRKSICKKHTKACKGKSNPNPKPHPIPTSETDATNPTLETQTTKDASVPSEL
eukprot:NODE_7022_length_819_cov_21.885057_g6420_i0.p1 GENE.NODE_7022_length_819_cov_21.885057_g6420_i0~~NODE_7022_length_819_cov_21.885057_g6420_i0.p1  ORF type:complete len:225 (+),score=30.82 NODE_7022_length_819_cov_21.885057_g6420_i0:74-676(+)